MAGEGVLEFTPYRLDAAAERLLRGDRVVAVRPKTFAVLSYLVSHAGRLVTRDELLTAVWGETVVSDDTLTQSIAELRRAFRDDPRHPRFIETAHGRGFRFVAPVLAAGTAALAAMPAEPSGAFIGRRPQLEQLSAMLERARRGERQLALVTGEAGIGKSRLVDEFLARSGTLQIGRGQCIQQYGEREPYLPVVDALEDLLRTSNARTTRSAIRRHAPTWAARLPGLAGAAARGGSSADVTQARSMREVALVLEEVAAQTPTVLVLEDLQWADPSTIDWLQFMALRGEAARLLIVGTCRSVEAAASEHPAARLPGQLGSRRGFAHIAVPGLDEGELRQYASQRLGAECSPALGAWLQRRTGGNALFAVAVTNQLVSHGSAAARTSPTQWDSEVPADLYAVIEQQIRPLAPRLRRTLDAASVAGLQLYSQEIAAALEISDEEAEETCMRLDHDHGLLAVVASDEWPDGSAGSRFGFRHDVYRQWVQQRMPKSTLRAFHQRIGRRLERGFGELASAPVLAHIAAHYEGGGDGYKAVEQLASAATRAMSAGAFREAKRYCDDARAQIERLAESPERDRRELELLRLCTVAEVHARNQGSASLEPLIERLKTLASRLGDSHGLFDANYAEWFLHVTRGLEKPAAEAIGRLESLVPILGANERVRLGYAIGGTAVWAGRLGLARHALEDITSGSDDELIGRFSSPTDYGVDPFVGALLHLAHAGSAAGSLRQARDWMKRGTALAMRGQRPFSMVAALAHSSLVEWVSGSREEAGALARRARTEASRYGFPLWESVATVMEASAIVRDGRVDEGLELARAGITEAARSRIGLIGLLYMVFVSACLESGRLEQGLTLVAEAFDATRPTLERLFEAELWRLKGELLIAAHRAGVANAEAGLRDAESALQKARETARSQQTWLFELRASIALARLWQAQGRSGEAVGVLEQALANIEVGEELPEREVASKLLQVSTA